MYTYDCVRRERQEKKRETERDDLFLPREQTLVEEVMELFVTHVDVHLLKTAHHREKDVKKDMIRTAIVRRRAKSHLSTS